MRFGTKSYFARGFYDELTGAGGNSRPHARLLAEDFSEMQPQEFE